MFIVFRYVASYGELVDAFTVTHDRWTEMCRARAGTMHFGICLGKLSSVSLSVAKAFQFCTVYRSAVRSQAAATAIGEMGHIGNVDFQASFVEMERQNLEEESENKRAQMFVKGTAADPTIAGADGPVANIAPTNNEEKDDDDDDEEDSSFEDQRQDQEEVDEDSSSRHSGEEEDQDDDDTPISQLMARSKRTVSATNQAQWPPIRRAKISND